MTSTGYADRQQSHWSNRRFLNGMPCGGKGGQGGRKLSMYTHYRKETVQLKIAYFLPTPPHPTQCL
eukprot:6187628-Pleurochrysis_carterae.AAC.2